MEMFKNRYKVPCGLKIDMTSVKSCSLSESEMAHLLDDFTILERRLKTKSHENGGKMLSRMRLTPEKILIASSDEQNKISLYIINQKEKEVGQTISVNEAIRIVTAEDRLVSRFSSQLLTISEEAKKEYALDNFLKSYFKNPNIRKNRQVVYGHKIREELEL